MLNVCVIFGGVSSEHEVSLRSAASVLENIDRSKYNVHMLGITKVGRWLYYTGPAGLVGNGGWERSVYARPAVFSPERGIKGIALFEDAGYASASPASGRLRQKLITGKTVLDGANQSIIPIDVVFPVLHGKFGEDGTLQGLLELAGIPYVGSGVLASAACMDKHFTHVMLEGSGVKKTKLIAMTNADLLNISETERLLSSELGYPMFIKPANAGSSVGISKVKTPDMLGEALRLALEHDVKAVAEQMVEGQEVECAVIGNSAPVAAGVVGEIVPANEFYDYAGKYLDDSTALYIPARVSDDVAVRVREIAVKAYAVMGCAGLARIDFFVKNDGDVILNEINTIPGFTSISMFPKLFEAGGLPYTKLISALIDYALEGVDV